MDPSSPSDAARDAQLQRARRRGARREQRAREARADVLAALPWAATGLLGALPAPDESSSVVLLVWLALWSSVAGFLAGASPLRLLAAAAVPGVWMLAFALVEAGVQGEDVGGSPVARGIPSPAGAAAAWTGLFAAGFGLGRIVHARGGSRWGWAGLVAALTAVAAGASLAGGLADRPWPPAWSAFALDVSPVVLVMESAGVADWMWHPSTYDSAGVDRFARAPFDPALAGPLALVVGCALAAVFTALARRVQRITGSPPWRNASTSAPSRST